MRFDSGNHLRKSLRLSSHDYTKPGYYFITICTRHSEELFGKIQGTALKANSYGVIVTADWYWLERQYLYLTLDEWILMPNHLHGIVQIKYNDTALIDKNVVAVRERPLQKNKWSLR